MTNPHAKQIAAIKLAIESLTRERRRYFAAGDHAYRNGMRAYPINGNAITGVGFGFAEEGHKNYQEYTDAIQQLEDMIEVLSDPGVTYENNADLPLFATRKGR